MTAQEYLDWLVGESKAGRFPVAVQRGRDLTPVYRHPDGRLCPIGKLLKANYWPDMEGRTMDDFYIRDLVEVPDDLDYRDLEVIHVTHDVMVDKWIHATWVRRLRAMDSFRGLTPAGGWA